ncbi:MAG: hypothetical protein OHK0022_09520 [Roseiflexaceae bacterium]
MAASKWGWLAGELIAGLAVGVLAGLALRPARVREARVVRRTAGEPARIEVGLDYEGGLRPVSVVVDVEGEGSSGSATVPGAQSFVEVLVQGSPDSVQHVTTTAAYRVLGVLRTDVRRF